MEYHCQHCGYSGECACAQCAHDVADISEARISELQLHIATLTTELERLYQLLPDEFANTPLCHPHP